MPAPPSNLSTEPVPQKALNVTAVSTIQPVFEVPELRNQGIALVIRGHDSPVLLQGSDIYLGRYDPKSPQPTFDLTPFSASTLGVSRRHARIHIQHDLYVIEDLNSTNGTWVNQQRLPAGKKQGLANGDLIQLGQLVLSVYFDAASAMRSVEERISFKSAASKFTPHYLATRLSPYLTALESIQSICDNMLQRPPSPIEISSITLDGPMVITVQISGASEALKLAKGSLKDWRKDNAGKINQFLTLKEGLGKRTSLLLAEDSEPISMAGGDEELARQVGRELRQSEIQVAFNFLREVVPQFTGDDRAEDVERLLKPLHILAFSPLQVTTGSNSLAH
ncbi:MAG: FHA domain-containing protein [Anaerolineae bacterium]|nr:FHA domain-containing protein [Anaerolineae bacterium]